MSNINKLFWLVLLMIIGESAMIAAEVYSSMNSWKDWRVILTQMFAAFMLIYAYDTGYKSYGDIWIVSTASVVTVVVAEPIIVWFMTKEIPTPTTALAFGLACLSVVVLAFGEK